MGRTHGVCSHNNNSYRLAQHPLGPNKPAATCRVWRRVVYVVFCAICALTVHSGHWSTQSGLFVYPQEVSFPENSPRNELWWRESWRRLFGKKKWESEHVTRLIGNYSQNNWKQKGRDDLFAGHMLKMSKLNKKNSNLFIRCFGAPSFWKIWWVLIWRISRK